MKKLSAIFMALAIGFIGIGCDSNSGDDELTASDLIIGNWSLTGVSDDDGDQLAAFVAGFNSVRTGFTSADLFTINVDAISPGVDQIIEGSYSVNESAKRLTLTTTVPGAGEIGLNFTYAFSGDDQVTLTADAVTSTLLNVLLGTTLNGTVVITITRN